MAMGHRKKQRQESFWIPADQVVRGPGHPFYRKLNALFETHGFDRYVEGLCEEFYHDQLGRPGIPPGVYFRMLLIGYFEGIDSERGIETPTREDLAKIDRKRKNKASNKDWEDPNDPDSKITKMKDGRTHLAHKAEHATDLDTGAIVGVTVQPADRGDTTSIDKTVAETMETLLDVQEHGGEVDLPREIIADKGYHSNATCVDLKRMGFRSYLSEPDRGDRKWEGKKAEEEAVYGNRRRIRGKRGKELLRKRGELVERPFAHCYDTGGMRRTHLRGHENILKRLLIHLAGFNLALILRVVFGLGKPRTLQDGLGRLFGAVFAKLWSYIWPVKAIGAFQTVLRRIIGPNRPAQPRPVAA